MNAGGGEAGCRETGRIGAKRQLGLVGARHLPGGEATVIGEMEGNREPEATKPVEGQSRLAVGT